VGADMKLPLVTVGHASTMVIAKAYAEALGG
jgi:hypothetical protein